MIVAKPLDLTLLRTELAAAGVVVNGLGAAPTGSAVPDEVDLYTFDGNGVPTDLPPEAGPVVDAHDATKPGRVAAFEAAEDAERLRLVNERARTDPAYAALADLALGKDR
jgi:hypothetical protein